MEKFIAELERILPKWPDHAEWALSQLSDYTSHPVDDVIGWMSFALKKKLDSHSRVSCEDGQSALAKLTRAHENGEHLQFNESEVTTSNLAQTFAAIKQRNLQHVKDKNWRRAYKNISNFWAERESQLTFDLKIEVLGEALRTATKARQPVQEIFIWLQTAVNTSLEDGTKQGVEEAIDFVDAYGEHLLVGENQDLIEDLLQQIQPLVSKFEAELMEHYQQMVADLFE